MRHSASAIRAVPVPLCKGDAPSPAVLRFLRSIQGRAYLLSTSIFIAVPLRVVWAAFRHLSVPGFPAAASLARSLIPVTANHVCIIILTVVLGPAAGVAGAGIVLVLLVVATSGRAVGAA